MKSLEEHWTVLKEISSIAFESGINSIPISSVTEAMPQLTAEEQIDFIGKCHDGFKLAQKRLIAEIEYYQELLLEQKKELKESRRARDKVVEATKENQIAIIEQRLLSLSHIADGIAWQMHHGEIHVARRLYIGAESIKHLKSSNIRHAIEVADEINKNPLNFALISDLTNSIQIGDLFVRHNEQIGIMELKEGKVNDQVAEFLDKLKEENIELSDESIDPSLDKSFVKQAKRVHRQKVRADRATEIINNDKGVDPVTGQAMTVGTPTILTQYYYPELIELEKELTKKTWSYTCIEGCLHIGMYRNEGILLAEGTIPSILKNETNNFFIVDWLSITDNVSSPLFSKPLSNDFLIDILSGKIKVVIGLNLDALIELFNYLGLGTRWMSEKETATARKLDLRKSIVERNNRSIAMKLPNGSEAMMSGGVISKILYDSIYPSNMALTILSVNHDEIEKK